MRLLIIALVFFWSFTSCGADKARAVRGDGEDRNANVIEAVGVRTDSTLGETKENKMSEDTIKQVTITATAENTAEALVVSYQVENKTDQALYLWDQMIGWKGNEKVIDHDIAYVFFEEPKTVRLIRADLPLPQLRLVGRKEIPYARVLPPRGTLSGKIVLKHPVKEYSPYYEPMTEEGRELRKCSEVRLMVGWTPPKPGMRIEEHNVGGEKLIAIRGAWPPPHQEILEEKILVNVDLLTYTTEFERQMPLK
jgi:hypothetical protein